MRPPAEVVAAGAVPAASQNSERTWTENAPSRAWLPRLRLEELWAEREVALILALKDIQVRYKQTFFGVAWAVLQPLVAVAHLHRRLRTPRGSADGRHPVPGLHLRGPDRCGSTSRCAVAAAAQSLVENRDLVTKVYFPRLLAPLAARSTGPRRSRDLASSFFAVCMVVYGVTPSRAPV